MYKTVIHTMRIYSIKCFDIYLRVILEGQGLLVQGDHKEMVFKAQR